MCKRLAIVFVVAAMIAALPSSPASAEEVVWLPPVDAEIIDPFRTPVNAYSAGNRGLEYGLAGPTRIRAVDDGQVVFAGKVGHNRFVVIDHGGGLRSTLAYLTEVHVVRGQYIEQGDIVAVAAQGFHLTARLDGVYIDPALLIAGVEFKVALIAGPESPGGARAPIRAVGQPVIERGRFDPLLAVVDSAAALSPGVALYSAAEAARLWHHQDCTPVSGGRGGTNAGAVDLMQSAPVPDRVLIQVAGLGSSSESGSIGSLNPVALGYAPDNVVGFSYNGGCAPGPYGIDPALLGAKSLSSSLAPSQYEGTDTYADINASAAHLADLIEAAAAERPGAPIDVVAHSLGGIVTRTALEILVDRNRADLLSTVMTVGSPHQGADIATIGSAASGGRDLADALLPDGGDIRNGPAVIQLSEVGTNSLDPPRPPPAGVTVVAVAGALDPIVAAPAAIWEGATNVLVNEIGPFSSHSDLPGAVGVQEAFLLARNGLAPACLGLAEVLIGVTAGSVTAAAENSAAVAAGIANWL